MSHNLWPIRFSDWADSVHIAQLEKKTEWDDQLGFASKLSNYKSIILFTVWFVAKVVVEITHLW